MKPAAPHHTVRSGSQSALDWDDVQSQGRLARWGAALARFLNLAEGEGERAFCIFCLIFTVSTALVFLKAVQSGIFLAAYPRQMIPWAFAAAALTITPFSVLSVAAAARLGPVRLSLLTLLGAALVSVALRTLLWASVAGTPFIVYVAIEAASGLVVIQTWSVVSTTVDSRSAKRILPLAGVGASVAWTLGGLLVSQLVHLIGASGLLLVVPLLLGLAMWLIRIITRSAAVDIAPPTAGTSLLDSWRAGFDFVAQVPLMRLCVLLSVLSLLGEQLMEYQLLATARERYGQQAAIAGFFGRFYGITSAISLVLQLGFSSRILARLGATQSLAITPVATALFGLAAIVIPGFAPIVLMRANDRVLKGALWASAMEQAQTPLPVVRRTQARVLSRGVVAPLAYALTAVILATLLRGADQRLLSFLTVVVVLGMLAVVITRLQRAYISALRRALDDRRLRLDAQGEATTLDRNAAEAIAADLSAEDEGRAVLAAELLQHAEPPLSTVLLRRGLHHPAPIVRIAVLDGLAHVQATQVDVVQDIATLLSSDPHADVRRAAVHTLEILRRQVGAARSPADDVLHRAYDAGQGDSDAQVRAKCRVACATLDDPEGVHRGSALVPLLSTPEPELTVAALAALGPRAAKNPDVLARLRACLAARDPLLRIAALEATVRIGARGLVHDIRPLLEDPRTVEAAVTQLVVWGVDMLDLAARQIVATTATLESPSSRSLEEIMGGVSPGLGEGLPRLLGHVDIGVRERAIATLARLVQGERIRPVPYAAVQPVLEVEIAASFRYLSLIAGIARDDGTPDWEIDPEYEFLGGEIDRRFRTVRQRVLRLLSLLHSNKLTSAVEVGLRRAPQPAANVSTAELRVDKLDKSAQVAELLEMALPIDLARRVVPLFDRLSLRERLQAAEGLDLLDHAAMNDPLAFVVGLNDEHLRVCAMITYGSRAQARYPELYEKDAALIPVFERMRFLRSVPLFAEIPGEDLRMVAEILDTVERPAGDVVFRKGETGEDMYIIVHGQVAIRDGAATIATLGVREFFGELSVIDREARSADAVVMEGAELLRLRAADLGELMARRPQIQEQIMLVLVRRLRTLNARIRA